MAGSASPRVGCVKYLNARPLIRGWSGEVVFDHPSALCQQLAQGELDVALVSSFEFLRNPIYRIADGLAIASDGPVYSVFLAREKGNWPNEIEIDPASATGATLLRVLLAEQGRKFTPAEMPPDKTAPLSSGRGRFLIGDQAIRFRAQHGGRHEYWDAGEEWRRLTGLPFVYALWLIRPEFSAAEEIATRLRSVRDANLKSLDEIAAEQTDVSPEFCRTYYRDYLRFELGPQEKQGLHRFGELCVRHGLLGQTPDALSFV